VVLALSTLAISLFAQRPGLKPKVFAIREAKIVSEPGKVIEKGTIVIRDGLIADVGESVAVPPDAIVIDGQGLTVYPGFIDACSTWGIDFALKRSEAGPAEIVDYAAEALAATKADNRKGITPEFEVATALKLDEDVAENWRKQGFTVRLAAPEGGILAGQSALVSLSGAVPREAVIRAPVAQHAAFKVTGPGYPNTLMGIMAHFRQTLLDAERHARLIAIHEKEGLGKRPPLDPALTSLKPPLDRKQPVVFEADSRDEIHRALNFCDEFRLKPILFGCADAWKAVERLKTYEAPLIVRLNFPDKPRMPASGRRGFAPPPAPTPPPADPAEPGRPRRQTPPGPDPALAFATPASDDPATSLPERVQEDNKRKHKEEMANAGALAKAGIRFALSANGLDKPEDFRAKLAKAIAEGLPPDAALAALTINAARILGVEPQLGTLAKGKAAHLIAMTGPFHETKSQVRHVFSDGVHFEYEPPSARGRRGEAKKPDEKADDEKKEDEEKPGVGRPPEFATEIEADRVPKLRTGGTVLIRNATILTVTNGTLKGDILVENGRIAKLGEKLSASMDVPVIDATGMYVMPGIIDTHSHFAMSAGINESTLSVVPEVRVRDIINSEDVQIYRGLAGGVTTARLLHGSANVIGGQDAVIKLKYGQPAHKLLLTEAPRGVKFALGENVKRTDGRFPNTRLGVEAVLIRSFTEAQAYKREWEEYRKKNLSPSPRPRSGEGVGGGVEPRRDLRLEALADILDGKLFVHSHCYRADEILMLLRAADQFGFKVKSLQHVLEGYKIAAEIAAHGASCSTFSDWWAYKLEAWDAIPWNAALLQEAGASVCMKSDSNELMRHLYQEAAKAMKYGGASETDALKMVTLNAAKQLGLDKRLGSIEVGKDADLAIFNAHPLDSFARCEMTLVDGEVYFQRPSFSPRTGAPLPTAKRGPEVAMRKITTSPESVYVISHVTIHDGIQPPFKGWMIVRDGNISIVKRAELPGPPEPPDSKWTWIDGSGLHLYPGLIDAGTIVGLTEVGSARETQDYSEGGDFQPDLRASIGINPDSEVIPVTRANGVLTVVTRPTGAVIAGQSALVNLNGWVPSEMVLIGRLALHIDFPTTIPMFSSDPSGPSVFRMIQKKQRDEKIRRMKELFKQALVAGTLRVPSDGTRSVPTTADPRLEALVPYAKGEKPVVITANRRADILEAIKLADELKIKMILSGGLDAWKVADELKKRDTPVLLGPIMAMPAEPYDPYDAPFACAAKLHQAGVRFCIRSAGGTNTRNLPYEAAMAVSYGLPPEVALKAITLYPAQILGVADRLGSIEQGKLANLVLTDGDILQATTQVHALFIAGTPVEPTSKQTRLYERYRQRLKEVKEGKAKLGTR
jgi:imidazolonepropionase-like amidohydrolase